MPFLPSEKRKLKMTNKPETKKARKEREIAERKAEKESMRLKREREIFSTPIAKAVAPVKADAIVRAEKDAREYVVRLTDVLAKNGFDLNKVAPAPNSLKTGREEYRTMQNRRNLFTSFTRERDDNDRNSWRDMTAAKIVEVDPAKVERFVDTAKEAAAMHYDSFVYKLVEKIGETTEARLEGNHVWGRSILHVTLKSGEKQKWKTQQIVNCSVYGLLFNQWPTRLVK